MTITDQSVSNFDLTILMRELVNPSRKEHSGYFNGPIDQSCHSLRVKTLKNINPLQIES